jgi:hypothetical protein
MEKLTLTALTAVAKQKNIEVPKFKTGTSTEEKKKAIQKLITANEKPAQKGATFHGEN